MLGDATKIVRVFLLAGKEYVCLMQLHSEVPEPILRSIFEEFTGEIYQKPPLRSSVRREVRRRRIYRFVLLEVDAKHVLFRVACEAGTYIRKICFDIGEALGCGAHMRELRRTRSGALVEDKGMYTLYDLLNAHTAFKEDGDEEMLRKVVRPMEEALELMPKIYVKDSAVDAICHGADLAIPGVVKLNTDVKSGEPIAIFTLKDEVVALANALLPAEKIMEQEKGVAAKTVRVMMPAGTYPKSWRS